MEEKQSEDFYKRLKEQLQETTVWPSTYLFKFIVLSEEEKIQAIHSIFDTPGAVVESKKSKNGKYTSVSITVLMKNPDEVIAKYREVGEIPGVISL